MSSPLITVEKAAKVALDLFGVTGEVRSLGSCQDANFLIRSSATEAFVLKISSSSCSREDLEFQNFLMAHLSAHINVSLPVALLSSNNNNFIGTIALQDGTYFVRLLTYLEGNMLSDFGYLSETSCRHFGSFIAKVSHALSGIETTYSRELQWDMRRATEVIHTYLQCIPDVSLRKHLSSVAERAEVALSGVKSLLRQQIVHCDLATYNIIAERCHSQPVPSGVIDFGDAMVSWLVGDLAIAITSSLNIVSSIDSCLIQVMRIVEGFHAIYPLLEEEIMALWPLIQLRSIVNIVSIQNELAQDASNSYNIKGLQNELHAWQYISSIDIPLAQEALRCTVNLSPMKSLPLCSNMFDVEYELLRCDVLAEINEEGNWLNAEKFRSSIKEKRRQCPSAVFVIPYGQPRMYYSDVPSLHAPATIALTADLLLPKPLNIYAPFDGTVEIIESGIALRSSTITIYIRGASSLDGICTVTAGSLCGIASGSDVTGYASYLDEHVSIHVTSLSEPVVRCSAALFSVYSRCCFDPLLFINPSCATQSATSKTTALDKRNLSVAAVQEHYYVSPPQIERGWKEYLYDTNCRAYVDMVNNVAVVGHSHPVVTKAATKQLQLLNTNSRFVYDALGSFATKILSTVPDYAKHALNTVLFVNSGSEATDLALRMARTVVSARKKTPLQRDTICLAGAYHGITTASDEVSTTLNDNPRALESRPEWVHLVPMPNLYRGKYTGCDAVEQYVDEVRQVIASLRQKNRNPVVFIAEPLSGNAGGVEIPDGYLQRVYAEVRAAGGLCIADEVQVGYGRLGRHFWGFEEHGVVPDILTMAKAAGNGFPLGYVITSREIAAEFSVDGSFFSSAGGGPVACAIGSAVIDIITKEKLQQNAAEMGQYFQKQLQKLQCRFPYIVGCVHGHGLYQGIELVRHNAPATKEAYEICERLLELGVVCHNTGDYSNVLKVKPPLVITMQSIDFIIQALSIALKEWYIECTT